MTEKELAAVIGGIVDALRPKFKAIEADLLHIKSQPYLKDAGTWRHGSVYTAGDVATFKGALWVCTKAHTANGPTADHACWRLLNKSGAAR